MSRCQHCKKLTHSEHLNVYFSTKDFEKIEELQTTSSWTAKFEYSLSDPRSNDKNEFGKLKIGDIVIHFILLEENNE